MRLTFPFVGLLDINICSFRSVLRTPLLNGDESKPPVTRAAHLGTRFLKLASRGKLQPVNIPQDSSTTQTLALPSLGPHGRRHVAPGLSTANPEKGDSMASRGERDY